MYLRPSGVVQAPPNTYAHLFAQADHANTAREALEADYQAITGTAGL
jgi:hypothetical protein